MVLDRLIGGSILVTVSWNKKSSSGQVKNRFEDSIIYLNASVYSMAIAERACARVSGCVFYVRLFWYLQKITNIYFRNPFFLILILISNFVYSSNNKFTLQNVHIQLII